MPLWSRTKFAISTLAPYHIINILHFITLNGKVIEFLLVLFRQFIKIQKCGYEAITLWYRVGNGSLKGGMGGGEGYGEDGEER